MARKRYSDEDVLKLLRRRLTPALFGHMTRQLGSRLIKLDPQSYRGQFDHGHEAA